MIQDATASVGAPEYSAHGLRKNSAIQLAEAGCSVQQIMSITGHVTWRQAMHYTQRREQRALALQAMDKLELAKPRTKAQRDSG